MGPEEEVTGKRSPEWAFLARLKIGKPGFGLYLDRLRIVATPWGGLYLHHILQPDPDPDPHDHPWPFRTLVLRGGYEEEFHPFPHVDSRVFRVQRWRPFSLHRMNTESAHRITRVFGDTWTLVFVGRRKKTWGFWTPDGWMTWSDYIGSTNKADR